MHAALLALLVCGGPVLAGGGDPPVSSSGGARWGADYFPNVPLITHEGKTVRFFDDVLKDKVVVINFIYTSCPDACPLETAKLTEVQSLLGDRVGRDVFMYSISIDPERDTPEKLREYSERFQTGPGWLFLTGEAADIRVVREKLGMLADDEQSLQDHTLSLLLGNQATGRWMKRSPFENPHFLASQIGSWLSSWKEAPVEANDYANAPKLREITRGESLFRTRCSACHLIGPEDGIRRQGPNLLGVSARRERNWLGRWLTEPDVMLAEKDPIALELYAAYRDLPMPNMRLNGVEVEALLDFMVSEDERIAAEAGVAAEAAGPSADDEEPPPCCQKPELGLVGDAAVRTTPALASASAYADPAPEARASGAAGMPRASLLLCAGLFGLLGCFGALVRRSDARA